MSNNLGKNREWEDLTNYSMFLFFVFILRINALHQGNILVCAFHKQPFVQDAALHKAAGGKQLQAGYIVGFDVSGKLLKRKKAENIIAQQPQRFRTVTLATIFVFHHDAHLRTRMVRYEVRHVNDAQEGFIRLPLDDHSELTVGVKVVLRILKKLLHRIIRIGNREVADAPQFGSILDVVDIRQILGFHSAQANVLAIKILMFHTRIESES